MNAFSRFLENSTVILIEVYLDPLICKIVEVLIGTFPCSSEKGNRGIQLSNHINSCFLQSPVTPNSVLVAQ